MVSNIFCFHPYLGKIPNLTNIFQRGWTHQQYIISLRVSGCFLFFGFGEYSRGIAFWKVWRVMFLLTDWTPYVFDATPVVCRSSKLHVAAACYATHGVGGENNPPGWLLLLAFFAEPRRFCREPLLGKVLGEKKWKGHLGCAWKTKSRHDLELNAHAPMPQY